jgi:hypothetical protein
MPRPPTELRRIEDEERRRERAHRRIRWERRWRVACWSAIALSLAGALWLFMRHLVIPAG